MYIEEITIEGFKSYAQRVIVPNFDPYFNAITGLNGSGKSNILDSICFVLGITNLSQVRANSLQELVYKQGQAGITKASVSIVFNNQDKQNSPVGYEHFEQLTVTRQLVIGGRNKYLINGHVAQPSRVQNLFHSVQLNVNNPHFLIMQGRITKVLNMKPPEVLGMLEEAAGTRMYETKKEAALKTLEKKQVKVDEIDRVLNEDILPALEKLRKEKDQYYQWQTATANLDVLRRFCIAYKYVEAQKSQEVGEAEIQDLRSNIEAGKVKAEELAQEIQEAEGDLKGLQMEKDLQSGGEVKELAQQVDELSKRLVKDTSTCSHKRENSDSEKAGLDQVRASIAELAEDALEARVTEATDQRDAASQSLEAANHAVEAAQRELAGAEAGDGRDESNRSLSERLRDAENAQTIADGEAEQAENEATHLRKQLQEQKKLLGSKEKEASKLQADLAKEQQRVDAVTQQLQRLDFDQDRASSLEADVAKETATVRQLTEEVDEISSSLAGLDFRFRDPEANFQRSRVKGVVAKLISVKDTNTATALEVAAGGKLFQVIVDTEVTSKALIDRGQLTRRYTIIPINKVSVRMPSSRAQTTAEKLSQGKARLAIELVGFDSELKAAMQYVFGSSFVCPDASTAKALAFNKDVRTRCITLEGDDFNPGGTLTGGSRNKGNTILIRLHDLLAAQAELTAHQELLRTAKAELQALAGAAKEHRKLTQDLELKTHALRLLQERVQGSESAQLADRVATIEQQLQEASQSLSVAKSKKEEMVAAAKSLAKDLANFGKEQGKHIAAAKAKLKSAKAGVEAARKVLKEKQGALTQAAAQKDAAGTERQSLAEQQEACELAVQALEKEVADLEAQVTAARSNYTSVSAQLDSRRARLRECDKEISGLMKARDELNKQLTDANVEQKKVEHKLARKERDRKDAGEHCQKLEEEFPWIASEKSRFGRAGSDYDFQARDPESAFQEYNDSERQAKELSKGVNRRVSILAVLNMFEKAEAEYETLTGKKRIVSNDKTKIEKVIAELDEKKREALEKTWQKVNQDFGSIFSTLLPGTSAKLDPQEGQSFLNGLEIKVAFGGVWKQSLSELSGGQRSLLALSLILAMLLFKPAPIYILDEVDAALDLSHTQNIGYVLKNHFAKSQFLVVSLKEGLFNNANVIYRTRFVDGVSTVTRTANNSSSQEANRGRKVQPPSKRVALAENVRA